VGKSQTSVAEEQVRPSQQRWFRPPHASQVPGLVVVSPMHTVLAAVQVRLSTMPQQGPSSAPQATHALADASPGLAQTRPPALQNSTSVPVVRTQHSAPAVPQLPASDAQAPAVQTPPTPPPQDSP
jgi:hypothetical protein